MSIEFFKVYENKWSNCYLKQLIKMSKFSFETKLVLMGCLKIELKSSCNQIYRI